MKSTMKNDWFFCFFTNAFSKVVPHPSTPDIRHASKQPHANVSENRFTACTRQQPLPPLLHPSSGQRVQYEIVGKHEETR